MRFLLSRRARRFPAALLGLAGCAPALAQADNQSVLQDWAQSTGSAAPALVQADGGSRLEWQVQAQSEAYDTRVDTPAGGAPGAAALLSPYQAGGHSKHAAAFNVRSSDADGGALFLQSALLATNDRAVLSKYGSQVSSFQLGGSTGSLQWLAGDVAAAYSPLGSNLGLRGLYGQLKVGAITLTSHAGTVAESWEALTKRDPLNNLPLRNSYLRDVHGAKVELEAAPGWRLFVTTQAYEDRADSLPQAPMGLLPAQARSHTVGATYQGEAWLATLETGVSRFAHEGEAARGDHATLASATLRSGAFTWRAGFNDIGALYAAVGAAAAPGVQEGFVGVDWQASPTLTLGADARRGAQRTAATAITDATRAPFDALGLRGSLNLNDWLPGLALQWQDMHSRQDNPQAGRRDTRQTQLSMSLSRGAWNLMGGLSDALADDSLQPAADSRARGWQASVGRSFSGDPQGLAWNAMLQLMANGQQQRLAATGQAVRLLNGGLSVSAQHARWGSLALSVQGGTMTPPDGSATLKQRAFQLDASYPLTRAAALKAYWRYTERNAGSATVHSEEQVGGMHLGLTF